MGLAFLPEGTESERLAIVALTAIGLATVLGWLQVISRRHAPPSFDQAVSFGSRDWLVAALSVAVVAGLSVQTWFRLGTTMAGGDISPPDGTAWLGRVFEPWDWTGSNLGQPSQLASLLPWAATLQLVHALGGNPELAQRVWYTALFIGVALAALFLMAALRLGALAAIVGTSVYVLNPYVVSVVNINPVYLAALGLLAAVPAALVAAGNGQLPIRTSVIVVTLSAPIFGYVYLNPPLVGMVGGAMLATPLLVRWLDGREAGMRCLRTLFLALPLLLLASAYWILPAVIYLQGLSSEHLASLTSWTWTEGRATIRNAFWLNTTWGWKFPEYYPFAARYESLPLSVLRFVLPAVAFAGLALGVLDNGSERSLQRERALRLIVAASSTVTLIILLSTGTNPPGSLAFNALYGLPFGWLLREPGRFLMVAALFYAVMVGTVLDALFRWVPKVQLTGLRRALPLALRLPTASLALVTVVGLGFPLYTGAVVPDGSRLLPSAHVRMPAYWKEMAQVIDEVPTPGALLMLPPDDFYQMPYTWGFYGNDGFTVDLLHRHVIVPNDQGYSQTSPQLLRAVKLTADRILARDWPEVEALTTALNAPLILVRRDIDTAYRGRTLLSPDGLATGLRAAPGFTLIRTVGSLDLFVAKKAMDQTEVARNFLTVNSQTPDLRLLSLLSAGTALVSGEPRTGVPNIVQAPALDQWQSNGDSLVWQPKSPPGWAYSVAELDSNTIVSLDLTGNYVIGRSNARVEYSSAASPNQVTVSVIGRRALNNGDFAAGQWGTVGDCDAILPEPRSYLSADVISNRAPGGTPALHLSASADSACESQRLDWHGGSLLVSLMTRPVTGNPPRLCFWEYGPDRCASLPTIPDRVGWSTFRTSFLPDPGTSALSLFLYADVSRPAKPTINEYANIRIIEVPALTSLALLASPADKSSAGRQLIVSHNSFSPMWQGSISGEHVLVDGMLNGWIVALHGRPFVAMYAPAILYTVGDFISAFALFGVIMSLLWFKILTLVRRRHSS